MSFQAATNDTPMSNLDSTKNDYAALGEVVEGIGAQVLLFSILPVGGKGVRRALK